MQSKICNDGQEAESNRWWNGLIVTCPICGREFGCNKAYHVYTALIGRKRQYYCSYSCYKQRPNPREKR
ncbi:hypothetical protein [uncultured Phascolarctobacterium sp.]|uniref:hypothetical protein n=1 Tax=uncultured Phascolarctobacterium sp. TaxID=512296 RepID=UPI002635CC72|nr:hypothetical protein [uncultured Phascolarctobacterium sp.]